MQDIKRVKVIEKTVKKNKIGVIKNNSKLKVSPYIRVSTKEDEQLNSYESQIKHYTKLIQDREDWELGKTYADEGISGTQIKGRDGFKQMIRDALNGEIDLIITKSISRFARNTVDTLKYVRLLKEANVAVYFEKENINTLTMHGETLLTILSSLAQGESESHSANVKMGFKMKMKRGEIVGGGRCLGYNYNKETKELSINEKEAEIVKYIFKRYTEGAGSRVIANELTENPNYYTLTGKKKWSSTTVLRILRNEKYVGDLLLGKYITTDPITKRVIVNMGEEDQYYVKNNHEPIIDRRTFNMAQEILDKRSGKKGQAVGKRKKYSRKYAFSSITYCGFCGSRIERRVWHSNKPWRKAVWMCSNYNLNGKQACPKCKGVDERLIEDAFVQTFNKLRDNDIDIIAEFIENVTKAIKTSDHSKEIDRLQRKVNTIIQKLNTLVDMRLNNSINDYIYQEKHNELSEELNILNKALYELETANESEATIKSRIMDIKSVLSEQSVALTKFNRRIFDKIVDEVILGDSKNGIDNPYTITFKLKSGLTYFNEIVFDENRTGGRDAYPYANIKTPLSRHMNILYKFEFPYDFGDDGRFKPKNKTVNNVRNITVKIAV